MDAFESVVELVLRRRGYWTRTSFKVELTKAEKRAIGRHSAPRWEVDLVAYKPATNEILAMECKSYLNSLGVQFLGQGFHPPERYKLFSEAKTRRVVLRRLAKQLLTDGLCRPGPKVRLGLAIGKLHKPAKLDEIRRLFRRRGWELMPPGDIADELRHCMDAGYENDVVYVTAKILAQSGIGQTARTGRSRRG